MMAWRSSESSQRGSKAYRGIHKQLKKRRRNIRRGEKAA